MERLLDRDGRPTGPVRAEEAYGELGLPEGVGDRPYVVTDMIATLDGKAVFGGPGATWRLGSATDHELFRSLRRSCDAVILGAGVMEADDPLFPVVGPKEQARRVATGLRAQPLWVVVSGHARLALDHQLFQGGPEHVWVVVDGRADPERVAALASRVTMLRLGAQEIDLAELGRKLFAEQGIRRLYSLGGPTLNGGLLAAGLLDELFMTLSAHLHGGSGVAGIVEGSALRPMPAASLVSVMVEGDEVFLRYRRK